MKSSFKKWYFPTLICIIIWNFFLNLITEQFSCFAKPRCQLESVILKKNESWIEWIEQNTFWQKIFVLKSGCKLLLTSLASYNKQCQQLAKQHYITPTGFIRFLIFFFDLSEFFIKLLSDKFDLWCHICDCYLLLITCLTGASCQFNKRLNTALHSTCKNTVSFCYHEPASWCFELLKLPVKPCSRI